MSVVALGEVKTLVVSVERSSDGPTWKIDDPGWEWTAEELAFAAAFIQRLAMDRVDQGRGWPEYASSSERDAMGLEP